MSDRPASGAPAHQRLCSLDELGPTGARGVTLPDGREFVVLAGAHDAADAKVTIRAYVNACPHRGMPLETFPDAFLDQDRIHLICSTHGARFRVTDGFCVSGPCAGAALTPVLVVVRGGTVFLDETTGDRM